MRHQQKSLIKSVFISKDKEEIEELLKFCETASIHLIAKSQIKFKAVPFNVKRSYDVIFFGSIRAANFFLSQEKIPEDVLIACIGQSTAQKLQKIGLTVNFIGEKSGNPDSVAKDFKNWLGNRFVLIPLSSISNKSISSQLEKENFDEIVVYETLTDCRKIEPCDLYIFTSPSNFNSFLQCNETPKGEIIAWGETTRKVIDKSILTVQNTLEYSSIEEIITLLS